MSTLALMRWLESTPERYDAGMRALTFGRVSRLHAAVAEACTQEPDSRVLEIGCGTGTVTSRLLDRGARVVALDQSPEMLEQARIRIGDRAEGRITWHESTASEIEALGDERFDAVVLCLCLSEMSRDERRFVLSAAGRCIAPGGRLVCADEIRAERPWQRILQLLGRAPQWLLGWLLAGSVSQAIPGLRNEICEAGLKIESEQEWLFGTLALFVAVPAEPAEVEI